MLHSASSLLHTSHPPGCILYFAWSVLSNSHLIHQVLPLSSFHSTHCSQTVTHSIFPILCNSCSIHSTIPSTFHSPRFIHSVFLSILYSHSVVIARTLFNTLSYPSIIRYSPFTTPTLLHTFNLYCTLRATNSILHNAHPIHRVFPSIFHSLRSVI